MPITLSMNQSAEHAKQRSSEWMQARCGRITASRIRDVMGTPGKRAAYQLELLSERLTGNSVKHYKSQPMQDGIDREPDARKIYVEYSELPVIETGFIVHPELEFYGASPDALVGHEGGLEIKCPTITTHIEWALEGVVPRDHRDQMYAGMDCTGRQWWDFMSYHPDLPIEGRSFSIRLPRDDARIEAIKKEVIKFHEEVEAMRKKLNNGWKRSGK